MKNCPSCNSPAHATKATYTSARNEYYCACTNAFGCNLIGPTRETEEEAIAAWDALPRKAEPPALRSSVYTIDGIDYNVAITHNGPATFCSILWRNKKGRLFGTYGVSICNPKDNYDQNIGERVSMRKACGINMWAMYKLRELYDAWREDQRASRGDVPIPHREILSEIDDLPVPTIDEPEPTESDCPVCQQAGTNTTCFH